MVRMENIDRPLQFGSFELHVNSRELSKGATRIRLQEQPFKILNMMLERPGQVVTREELQKQLWPEGTFVDFEHSLNAAVKRLRSALGDDADNPRFVETLPRRGYRFISAVEAQPPRRPKEGTAPQVRLVVLPFSSLSDGQEYFRDGLIEELTSQLEQMYRGRIGIIARRIGQSLRADYFLEGSIRREGDRVRITARLIESSGETLRWSDTYERHLTDSLSVQTDIAARIARSLALELAPDQPPGTLDTASDLRTG